MGDSSAEKGREALRAVGRPTTFRRGDRLISLGAESDHVLLLTDGLVKAVLFDSHGSATVTGLFGRGDLLGEMGVLGRRPRTAEIVGLRAGTAVRVPGEIFLRMQEESRDVRGVLDEAWRQRQRHADDRQLAQTRELSVRVATSLLRWARAHGRRTEHGLLMRGLSQRDIAQAVCASEKSVEAVLAALREDGLLRTGRLRYLLPSPSAIESMIAAH